MLEAKITKELIHISAKGNLPTLYADLTQIVRIIVRKLDDEDSHLFKVIFTKGVLDGVIFGTNPEEMYSIVEELKESNAKASELLQNIDILNELCEILGEMLR